MFFLAVLKLTEFFCKYKGEKKDKIISVNTLVWLSPLYFLSFTNFLIMGMYYFIMMIINIIHSFSKYFSVYHEPGGFLDTGDTALNKLTSLSS